MTLAPTGAPHSRQLSSRVIGYYHYTQNPRLTLINEFGTIFWSTPFVWYTPDRYETVQDAQEFLALPLQPTHRVGPISEDSLPHLVIALRRVQPNFGQPGGGWEIAVGAPVYLSRISTLR